MTMIRFVNHVGTQLYVSQGAPGCGFLAYYLCLPPDPLPPELNMLQTWQDYKGFYLFLRTRPESLDTLAAQIAGHLPGTIEHTGFAWVDYSDETGVDRVQLLTTKGEADKVVIAGDVRLSFGGYILPLFADCPVVPVESGEEKTGFRINYPQKEGWPPPVPGKTISLPFTGDAGGCLKCEMSFRDFSDDPRHGWNVGLRYFYKNSDPRPGENGEIVSHYFPVFHPEKKTQVLFNMCWDPVDPLNPRRTYLEFTGILFKLVYDPTQPPPYDPYRIERVTPGILPSYFTTVFGARIGLRPLTAEETTGMAARLVFAALPGVSGGAGAEEKYYLVPAGGFEIVPPPPAASAGQKNEDVPCRIMCGISGVEHLGNRDGKKLVLHFVPGRAAYAPKQNDLPPLTTEAKTSWVYLSGTVEEDGVCYYAQPDDSIIYQPRQGEPPGEAPSLLYYMEVPAGELPPFTGSEAFPMVPYSGVKTESPDAFLQYELQVINPVRGDTIHELLKTPPKHALGKGETADDETDRKGVTPQGILLTFDAGLTEWKAITLARTGKQTFRFVNICKTLKSVFQTNQMFFVASDADKFDAVIAEDTCLEIGSGADEKWTFPLAPGKWVNKGDKENTILLFKFCDHSIEEMADDTGLWCEAGEFNGGATGVAGIQQQLLEIIKDAREKQEEEDFKYFYQQVIHNKNWNGILVLRCPVSLNLPTQLRSLVAGIDASKFYAHHIGINVTPIKPGRDIEVEDTALFGLIYYEERENRAGEEGGCQFHVSSLRVAFENSEVIRFSSQVELTVAALFAQRVNLKESETGNNIILNGVYQKHNEQAAYVFLQEKTSVFEADSKVIHEVEIERAQFVTVVTASGDVGEEENRSRFQFWGSIRFHELPGLDLFSFDKLCFSNLGIDMLFDPDKPEDKYFRFDAGSMTFDMAGSVVRSQSLFKHFPLTFTGIIQADEGASPQDLGYVSVTTPDLQQSSLVYPWYALRFELNLGTMGDLASKAGFTAELITGWGNSDSASDYIVQTGIILPGVGAGKKGLSLQGVLKLDVNYIMLTASEDEKTGNRAYVLKLKNVKLKVFLLSLPPGAQVDMILFGDPNAGEDNSTLGWYLAYSKDKKRAGEQSALPMSHRNQLGEN
jgi:hypothetical protein